MAGANRGKAAGGDTRRGRPTSLRDGHDSLIRAVVRYRPAGEVVWGEAPLRGLGNDEWESGFAVGAPGAMEFTVQAWIDRFGRWRHDLAQRLDAGWDVTFELLDGAASPRGGDQHGTLRRP